MLAPWATVGVQRPWQLLILAEVAREACVTRRRWEGAWRWSRLCPRTVFRGQIVDELRPQVVRDTVMKQIVDVPVLQCQEGIAEQIVDFSAGSQGGTRGGLEQTVAFLLPQIKEKIAEVFHARVQERIHEDIVKPSFPNKCRRRKRQKGHVRETRRMSPFSRCRWMRPRRCGKPTSTSRGIWSSLRNSRGTMACCEPLLREQAGFRFSVLFLLSSLHTFLRPSGSQD